MDTLEDEMAVTYGLWPERYLLVEDATVRWASSLRFEERLADVPRQLATAAADLWP